MLIIKYNRGERMSKGKSDVNEIIVNTTAIAKMFNLTERRVRQLVEEGIINRIGHGRFDLIDTVSKYITYLKLSADTFDESDVAESLDYEKWLHEKAKREKAEIELAHLKNEMHRSEEIEKVLNHMVMAFRSKMLSLPSKMALILVNKNDPKLIEALIERDIHEALKEISEYDPSLFIEASEEDEVDVVEVDESGKEKYIESIQKNS